METNLIICPYCKQEVSKEYQDKVCPYCGDYVKSKDWVDKQVDSIIRTMKRRDLFNYVSSVIFSGNSNLAIDELRSLSNREDPVVEQAFIERVLKGKPSTWGQKNASPDASNKIQCPYCKTMVDERYAEYRCPVCSNTVKTQKFIDIELSVYIRKLRKAGVYQSVQELVWDGNTDDALKIIRMVIGQKGNIVSVNDDVVEPVVISAILKDRPENYIRASNSTSSQTVRHVERRMAATNNLTPCPDCGRMISKQAESCPGCGRRTGVHVCPSCGSINTKTISELSKAGSVLLWGIFAANKVKSTYECLDCKQKF